MGIQVLGPLTLDDSAPRLSPRDTLVLAALAAAGDEALSADQLAEVVWGSSPPPSWQKNLQSCVVRLRKALGPDAITTTRNGYRLGVPAEAVDARQFESLANRGHELLQLGEPDRAAYALSQALALWRGRPYSEIEEWEPGSLEAARLTELRLDAQEWWLEASVAAGHHRDVLAQAQALAQAAPLRERRWELLALAQYRAGRQGEALATIAGVRRRLADELGIDPGPGLDELERAILQQDPTLDSAEARARASEACPYLGLAPYDVDDTESFFGRDRDIRACLERLEHEGVLAVLGPSGSGKSSLVRAGLVASLARTGRHCDVITPGRDPVGALPPPRPTGKPRLLVVDQAEELFSLCTDPAQRDRFAQLLADHAAGAPLVLALRADRMGDVSAHPQLARLVERGLYVLAAMTPDELREAIEGPARQTGLIIEPGLVDLLVNEVENEPGALPLLSHALRETWLRREGRTLSVAGYQASGGIRGAVAQSAERLYGDLEPAQRTALHGLLLRLVSPGQQGEPVRARVPRRQVVATPDQDQLVDRLVKTRLVTSDDGVLEIAHEALARAWPRLRGWLEDDIEGQRILHHLSTTADTWDDLGRPASELYRGVRLAQALEWRDRPHPELNDTETAFLDASAELADAERAAAAEQARRQTRLIRRLRVVLAGACVLLLIALAAGGYAAYQQDQAEDSAAAARQAAVSADARRVGARAQLTEDISLSLLLAAAGARLDDSPETRTNLMAALAERPTLVRSAPPGGPFLEAFDVSPDGRWIASSDDQNRMNLYDTATNRVAGSYDARRWASGEAGFLLGAFSPDSSQLAVILQSAKSGTPVRLLDPDTMRPTMKLAPLALEPMWGVNVGFSGDGRYLAATALTVDWYETEADELREAPAYAAIWDLRSPATPPRLVRTGTDRQALALSPDGHTLYTGWPLTAHDVAHSRRIWRREELTTSGALDVNPKGTLLALPRSDGCGTGRLVSAATGATVHTLPRRACEIRFSPDGTLVGSLYDGELHVWETATGQLLQRAHTIDPWGLGFSPDNDRVYTGGGDSKLRTWDLSVEETYLKRTTQVDDSGLYTGAAVSPDGQRVAYRWLDDTGTGWVRFVNTATGETTPPAELPSQFSSAPSGRWHPSGRLYVGWCARDAGPCPERGVVTILDSVTGHVVNKVQLIDEDIYDVAFVDGNRRLLVGSSQHTSSLIDADTLAPTGETFDFASDVATPIGDGSIAMAWADTGAGFAGHVRVVDLDTGHVLTEADVDTGVWAADAAPDGSNVAMAGTSGEIVTVDALTGDEQRRSTGLGAGVQVLWLDYSDDGKLLVSGADDGGVSLWDAANLDLMGTIYPPDDGEPVPAGARFIGDTHDVAIASYDGTVYRWETGLDRAVDFACRMAGRDLTEGEWQQFLPEQPYRQVCPEV